MKWKCPFLIYKIIRLHYIEPHVCDINQGITGVPLEVFPVLGEVLFSWFGSEEGSGFMLLYAITSEKNSVS